MSLLGGHSFFDRLFSLPGLWLLGLACTILGYPMDCCESAGAFSLALGHCCLPRVILQALGKGFTSLRMSPNSFSISFLMFGIAFPWTKPSIPQRRTKNRTGCIYVLHYPQQAVLGLRAVARAVPSARNILPMASFPLY